MPELLHAWRAILRRPGFSLAAVLTLALGIGAATAVFTLVHAVLLKALPFRDPDRLVWMYNARTERDRAPFSIPDLEDYQREASTLAGLATFTNWTANLTGAGEPERLEGTRVAANFFDTLGASAAIGRVFGSSDEDGDTHIAVLTDRLWTRRFASDRRVIGRSILLNGVPHTVVGVLPAGFLFPFRDAEVAVPFPIKTSSSRGDRGANFVRVVARLKPRVTIPEAKADLDAIARRLQAAYPEENARKTGVNLFPLHAEIVSDYRQILWTLFAAVGVLVMIGCGNLANLLLVRTANRRAELALRVSLGASPGRLARQLLAEAMLLAALAGALGLALAEWAVWAWRAFGPAAFPRMAVVAIDGRVVLFAAAAAIGVGFACGLAPVWAATRPATLALNDATRSLTSGPQSGVVRRAFVVVQVAGCAVLLICMGLVGRGVSAMERVDPGFTPDEALTVQFSLPPSRYAALEKVTTFYDALHERVAVMPGTRAAGVVSLLPLSGLLNTMDLVFLDRPVPPPSDVPQAHARIASDGYFAAAGIHVLDGREFDRHDDAAGRRVAIVSRTFAARHWPGDRPVGKQVKLGTAAAPALDVVGVVDDVKQFTMDGASTADVYTPLRQMLPSQVGQILARMNWVIRTDDPAHLAAAVRAAVQAIDPDIAASTMRTLGGVVDVALAGRRTNARLLQVFGEAAILIAGIGVYAIAAFSAAARRRELAIRAALGAGRGELIRLVIRQELAPVLVGVAAGVAAAAVLARALVGALFNVSPWDAATYASVAVGLLVVSLVAMYLPAMRAGATNPVELLRS